jgi:soluble lytic murein transglycosylase-like protein
MLDYTNTYQDLIKSNALNFDIDAKLITAIIKTESSFNPYAIRPERGFWKRYWIGIKALFYRTLEKDEKWLDYPDLVSSSYGLMQLMLTTAMELGFRFTYPTELLNPVINIKFGCKLLRKFYDRYGSWDDAISSYNQGNNKKNLDGTYKNQDYVNKVKQNY